MSSGTRTKVKWTGVRRLDFLWSFFSFHHPPCLPQRPRSTFHIARSDPPATRAWFAHDDGCCNSNEIESVRPPEILCQILQIAIGSDGVKALLPLTHVSAHWRRAALGDSSLWTIIHLKHTTAPLLDLILAHAGNRLFTVYVDHHDFDRLARLWERFDRVEELHYIHDGIENLTTFISSLGPAPNLKALHLQPGLGTGPVLGLTKLNPLIFSGCSPSLRTIKFSNSITWPIFLFRDLVSFEYGDSENCLISVIHVFEAIRESPSIKFIRLVGVTILPEGLVPPILDLPLLEKCTLVGDGTTSLIQFVIAPVTTLVSLSKWRTKEEVDFPMFNDCSVAPGIRLLGEVSTVSVSIDDNTARLQARNHYGGVLDARVDGLRDLSRDPPKFAYALWSYFHCWSACPGFGPAKQFTLSIERSSVWLPEEGGDFSIHLMHFILNLPSVEEITLRGVPPRELSEILSIFSGSLGSESQCPFLKRLHIESTPLRSPRSLLVLLDKLFAHRKGARIPLQIVTVKARCENLIPATDHCTFLAAWEGFVGDVWLEYERTVVNRSPDCRRYDCGCGSKDDEGGGVVIGDPGDRCVGWDGWPENWPKTMGQRRADEQGPHKVESLSIPLLGSPESTLMPRGLPSTRYLCHGGEIQEFVIGPSLGILPPPTIPVTETKRCDSHCTTSTSRGSCWFAHNDDRCNSNETGMARPREILGQILQFAVGSDGVKTLLPLTHVSSRWRRVAFGDSSLWATIHLKHTTAPLFDMILAHAGNQLFTVYIDHHNFDRLAKLWKLFDRVEELHYIHEGIKELTPFITSLGPAPNLKVLYLQPGPITELVPTVTTLPVIFSGYLPSLRNIALPNAISWPVGLFGGLVSFECGSYEYHPISALRVLDVLQYSPSLEFLRLVGSWASPDRSNSLTTVFSSLKKCTLIGDGTTALIQSLILPVTALVSLSKLDIGDEAGIFPRFNDHSVAPALCILDDISAISVSISDYAIGIRAGNDHGGVVEAKVDGLHDRSRDPPAFARFIRRSFDAWRICPGFDAAKEFTLCVERGRVWEPGEAEDFALNVVAFFFNLPDVEEVNLLGLPPRELSLILEYLCCLPQLRGPCPNLERLHIETTPLRSPRSLLAGFGRRLAGRKEQGLPFKSVAMKVKCETLLPVTEHRAFLASWEGFVGEAVRLEYEQTEVKKLPRCGGRSGGDEDKDEEEEEAFTVGHGNCYIQWNG